MSLRQAARVGRRPRWPSLGLVLVLVTYCLTLSFFAWALKTPPLDRVWTLHHELKTGETWKLKKRDVALLREMLAKYDELAESLLSEEQIGIISAHREGWIETPHVTVVRTPEASGEQKVSLIVQTPEGNLPLTLVVIGRDWEQELEITDVGTIALTFPPTSGSELVQLKFKGKKLRADPSSLGIRIRFGE